MKITLVKSLIGVLPKHKATAESLGLKRPGNTVEVAENAAINGKIAAISIGTQKFAQCTAYLNYQSTHSNNVLEEYYNHKLKATVQVVDAAGNTEMLTYIREHVRSSFDKAFEDALGEHYSEQTGGASEANKWHTMIKEANFQLTNMRAQYAEIAKVKAQNLYDLENFGYANLPA